MAWNQCGPSTARWSANRWVVDLTLDMCDYQPDLDLTKLWRACKPWTGVPGSVLADARVLLERQLAVLPALAHLDVHVDGRTLEHPVDQGGDESIRP